MAYGDITRLNSATAQLAATTGTLYTAPTGKAAQIGSIIIHNTNATTSRIVELFDNGSAASNKFFHITLGASEMFEFSPKVPLVLQGSETLQGKASAASEVNIRIYGREDI
jgi:hypothetical protein